MKNVLTSYGGSSIATAARAADQRLGVSAQGVGREVPSLPRGRTECRQHALSVEPVAEEMVVELTQDQEIPGAQRAAVLHMIHVVRVQEGCADVLMGDVGEGRRDRAWLADAEAGLTGQPPSSGPGRISVDNGHSRLCRAARARLPGCGIRAR